MVLWRYFVINAYLETSVLKSQKVWWVIKLWLNDEASTCLLNLALIYILRWTDKLSSERKRTTSSTVSWCSSYFSMSASVFWLHSNKQYLIRQRETAYINLKCNCWCSLWKTIISMLGILRAWQRGKETMMSSSTITIMVRDNQIGEGDETLWLCVPLKHPRECACVPASLVNTSSLCVFVCVIFPKRSSFSQQQQQHQQHLSGLCTYMHNTWRIHSIYI